MAAVLPLVTCVLLLSAYTNVVAQEPTLTITSNDVINGIDIGESVSLNCTVTLPAGYYINANFGSPTWRKVDRNPRVLVTNTSVEKSEESRISAAYYNINSTGSTTDHIFELTIENAEESDFGVYSCGTTIYYAGAYYTSLVKNVYLSVGVELSEDKPTCYIIPSEMTFKDLNLFATCTLKNTDVDQRVVEWTILYPDGSSEQVGLGANYQGLNYIQHSSLFHVDKFDQEGIRFLCSVTVPNGGPAMSCTTEAIDIIDGVEIIGDNLLGGNIGETAAVTVQIPLPLGFYVTSATWGKYTDMNYELIVENDMLRDDQVDLN